MTCPIRPLRDRVVVIPETRELSSVIFVQNNEKYNLGTVAAVGPNVRELKAGEKIRYGNGTYLDWPVFEFGGLSYQLIQEADVTMVLDED